MLGQINYELECSPKQSAVIDETLRRYNRACEHVLDVAQKKRLRGHINIAKLMVPDPTLRSTEVKLRVQIQDRFKIGSGLGDNAIRHVSWELSRAESEDREPSFDGNDFIFYSQQTASLVMKAQHPSIIPKPPVRLSLSMAKTRFQFPYSRRGGIAEEFSKTFKANDLVLWVGGLPDEHVFLAFIEVPEDEE